jgi:hypothetical protein
MQKYFFKFFIVLFSLQVSFIPAEIHFPSLSYNLCIKNLVIDHRFDLHKLEISLSFPNSEAIENADKNFRIEKVREAIIEFLENYADKSAYWEILNRNLVLHLAEKFPFLDLMTSKIKIFASPSRPHDRWSRLYFSQENGIDECFGFVLQIEDFSNLLDEKSYVDISFDYLKNIPKENYPNFFDIKTDLINLFQLNSMGKKVMNLLHSSLVDLLKKYSMVDSFKIQLRHSLFRQDTREDNCEWTMIVERQREFPINT